MIDQVVAGIRVASPPPGMTTKVIAVDGPGDAGKSTLAECLSNVLGVARSTSTCRNGDYR